MIQDGETMAAPNDHVITNNIYPQEKNHRSKCLQLDLLYGYAHNSNLLRLSRGSCPPEGICPPGEIRQIQRNLVCRRIMISSYGCQKRTSQNPIHQIPLHRSFVTTCCVLKSSNTICLCLTNDDMQLIFLHQSSII